MPELTPPCLVKKKKEKKKAILGVGLKWKVAVNAGLEQLKLFARAGNTEAENEFEFQEVIGINELAIALL